MATVNYLLKDTYPDGWNGNTLKFNIDGITMYTLGENFDSYAKDPAQESGTINMECGTYEVICGGGSYMDEISFTLTTNNGVTLDGICDYNKTYNFSPCTLQENQNFCDESCKMISEDKDPDYAYKIDKSGDVYCTEWASSSGWCGKTPQHISEGKSCQICSLFNRSLSFTLTDKMQDGWNGHSLTISDKNNSIVRVIEFQEEMDKKDGTTVLACGEYNFTCDAGDYPDETSWGFEINKTENDCICATPCTTDEWCNTTTECNNQIYNNKPWDWCSYKETLITGDCHGATQTVNIC